MWVITRSDDSIQADPQGVGLGGMAVDDLGKFWFVTWTTYGSWLPGDRRGFRTLRGKEYIPPPRRYAKPGEEDYNPKNYADRYRQAKKAVPLPVRLSEEEKT